MSKIPDLVHIEEQDHDQEYAADFAVEQLSSRRKLDAQDASVTTLPSNISLHREVKDESEKELTGGGLVRRPTTQQGYSNNFRRPNLLGHPADIYSGSGPISFDNQHQHEGRATWPEKENGLLN